MPRLGRTHVYAAAVRREHVAPECCHVRSPPGMRGTPGERSGEFAVVGTDKPHRGGGGGRARDLLDLPGGGVLKFHRSSTNSGELTFSTSTVDTWMDPFGSVRGRSTRR